MGDIKISVIIPVYNVAPYVEQCLVSVLDQSLRDIEIICVDDCGADGSMRIVERLAESDPRIKIVRHERNMGQGQARNTGLAAASGKYLLYVDSDDWIRPGMLEAIDDAFETGKPDWIWYNYVCFLEDHKTYAQERHFSDFHSLPDGVLDIDPGSMANFPVMACNKAYRTELVKKNRLSWSAGVIFEDNDYYFKCALLFPRPHLLGTRYYVYRIRAGSTMERAGADDARYLDIFRVLRNAYAFLDERRLFERHRDAFLDMALGKAEEWFPLKKCRAEAFSRFRELLDALGFPETCRGYSDFELLQAVYAHAPDSSSRLWYSLTRILSNFAPSRQARQKYRRRIRLLYKEVDRREATRYVHLGSPDG